MISSTGIWSASEALPENYPKSEVLARKLINVFRTDEPVIDFGCGDCFYIHMLHSAHFPKVKFKVFGFDGHVPKDHYEAGDDVISGFDLAFEKDMTFGRTKAPLRGQVLSLEVGEHIPKKYEHVFINTLCRHCSSRLVLSWAVPGQNGIGHVNCQTNDYIMIEVCKRGFEFNQHVTDFLRTGIEMHVKYFSDTLMVFDKI